MKNLKFQRRRDFIKGLGTLSALFFYPMEFLFQGAPTIPPQSNRLSWRANRGTHFEGPWSPRKIEGSLPGWLEGTLYRNGPGSKEVFGRALNHYFDGDGYLTSFKFHQGEVSMRSRFVETPERRIEIAAQKMLYHDFGTACAGIPHGYKKPPNIHIFPFANELFALSEASHPTRVDGETLASLGLWNFRGGLPSNVTFTAHPKVDPKTGDLFAYGISRSLKPELKIYRISAISQQVTELASFALGGFYPIHDMMMTENYLVIVVSPLRINMLKVSTLRGPISEALEYDSTKPLRILVFRKDGAKDITQIESSPSGYIFHHVNAYEDSKEGVINFDSFVLENASIYEVFKAWSAGQIPQTPETAITRFQIDLETSQVISRSPMTKGLTTDFPSIDHRLIGQPLSFFHALQSDGSQGDPLAFNMITRWNLDEKISRSAKASAKQVFGEAVFVPGPQNLIMHLGYDGSLDESFLDLRDADSLNLVSRIWLGRYLPLGFHGSFVAPSLPTIDRK